MTAPAIFKQSDVTRAIKGVQRCNVEIGRIEIAPDGKYKAEITYSLPTPPETAK